MNRQGVSKRGEPRIIIPRSGRPRLISGHVFPPGVSHRVEPRHGFEYHSNELHPTLPLYIMLYYAVLLMVTHNVVVIGEVVLRFLLSLPVDIADK